MKSSISRSAAWRTARRLGLGFELADHSLGLVVEGGNASVGRSTLATWLKDMTGKTSTGLYVVAGLEVLAAILILVFMPRQNRFTLTA